MCSLPYPTMVIYYCFFQATTSNHDQKRTWCNKNKVWPSSFDFTYSSVCAVPSASIFFAFQLSCSLHGTLKTVKIGGSVCCSTQHKQRSLFSSDMRMEDNAEIPFFEGFLNNLFPSDKQRFARVTEYVQNKRKREMKFFLPKMWCSPSCRGMWWEISHT